MQYSCVFTTVQPYCSRVLNFLPAKHSITQISKRNNNKLILSDDMTFIKTNSLKTSFSFMS